MNRLNTPQKNSESEFKSNVNLWFKNIFRLPNKSDYKKVLLSKSTLSSFSIFLLVYGDHTTEP